jgi:hypothetical protein
MMADKIDTGTLGPIKLRPTMMKHPVLSTARFAVGFNDEQVGLTYQRSNGTKLTIFLNPREAEDVGTALKIASTKLKGLQQ